MNPTYKGYIYTVENGELKCPTIRISESGNYLPVCPMCLSSLKRQEKWYNRLLEILGLQMQEGGCINDECNNYYENYRRVNR